MNKIRDILLGIAIIMSLATIQPIQNIHGQQKLSADVIFEKENNSIVGILLPEG
jgi:hypothetical protein